MVKSAIITGITGQDGSYLAEMLLDKGYVVHGMKRRSSQFNTGRIDHLYQDRHVAEARLRLHFADMTDASSLARIVADIAPDEIYNLGAQSHVAVSFENPEYTSQVDALGTLRLLEAIRFAKLEQKTRFYQASSSELYGLAQAPIQNETTPFYPRSPYAVAKLYAYWISVNYREAYGIYACNGILFNHESPRRGETFVTRKITRGIARFGFGLGPCLYMGNINAKRDWGHAREYMHAAWAMLQQEQPQDYVIATGQQHSVRDFLRWAAADAGLEIEFSGKGVDEIATVTKLDAARTPALSVGDVLMRIDPAIYRPTDVETLHGDPSKAERELGWKSTITARALCAEMMQSDLQDAREADLVVRCRR